MGLNVIKCADILLGKNAHEKKIGVRLGSWKNLGEPSNCNASLTPVKERLKERCWKLSRQQHNLRKVHQSYGGVFKSKVAVGRLSCIPGMGLGLYPCHT